MHYERFNEIALDTLNDSSRTLTSKGEEYSRNGDRLHNFKRAAQIDKETPERSLKGIYKKHLVSILDMIDDLDRGKFPTIEMLNEKIRDSINYHILLKALFIERMENSNNDTINHA